MVDLIDEMDLREVDFGVYLLGSHLWCQERDKHNFWKFALRLLRYSKGG